MSPKIGVVKVGALVLATAATLLVGCSAGAREVVIPAPATVESIPGATVRRVHLTEDAVRRIDLKTGAVTEQQLPVRMPAALALPVVPGVISPTAGGVPVATPGDTEPPKVAPVKGAPATTLPPTTLPPTTVAAPIVPVTFPRLVVPFAAVLYEPSGQASVFVVEALLSYVRQPVVIDYVLGDQAVLVSGPAVGALVVTTGATQLLGAELGVGGEELG